jgi:hypothetical protein
MSDMIERIARAMCEEDGANWNAANFNETANGDEPEEQREYWRAKARAVLEAMKEPTPEMVEAGYGYSRPEDSWFAMISKAMEG